MPRNKRKYADYEYNIKGGIMRVEPYGRGWIYRLFIGGEIISSNSEGEMYRTKRDAKAAGLQHAKILELAKD